MLNPFICASCALSCKHIRQLQIGLLYNQKVSAIIKCLLNTFCTNDTTVFPLFAVNILIAAHAVRLTLIDTRNPNTNRQWKPETSNGKNTTDNENDCQ